MTGPQMLIEFRLGLDKADTQSYPDFYPEQIYYFINKAIEKTVNAAQKYFEENQLITDSIQSLVETKTVIASVADTEASHFPLPDNYRFYVSSMIEARTETTVRKVRTVQTQHNQLSRMVDDPFNTPQFNEVPILFANNFITARKEGFDIGSLSLTFVRHPSVVSNTVPCDLATFTHKEIVDVAVSMALENIESVRGRVAQAQSQENE